MKQYVKPAPQCKHCGATEARSPVVVAIGGMQFSVRLCAACKANPAIAGQYERQLRERYA